MRIVIEFDTATLTQQDRDILTALGGHPWGPGWRDGGYVDEDAQPDTDLAGAREAKAGTPIDLSEGRAKEVPCLHYADETGVCKRCGEQVTVSEAEIGQWQADDETPAEEKPKRKRRTKAEMEAARRQEEAVAEANRLSAEAETAQEQGEAGASEPEQAETVQEDAPEPEAVSEAPAAAEGDRTIDEWRKEAVAQATAAVAEGRRSAVKTALDAVGAKRVGELRDDQLAAFLGALKDA